jgi:hypothetical protein
LRHSRPMNRGNRDLNTRRLSRFRAKIEQISAWDRSTRGLFSRTIQNNQPGPSCSSKRYLAAGISSATRGTAAHAVCSAGCPVGSAGGSGSSYAERSATFASWMTTCCATSA